MYPGEEATATQGERVNKENGEDAGERVRLKFKAEGNHRTALSDIFCVVMQTDATIAPQRVRLGPSEP